MSTCILHSGKEKNMWMEKKSQWLPSLGVRGRSEFNGAAVGTFQSDGTVLYGIGGFPTIYICQHPIE